jgi:hypothetical protein
MDYYGVGIHQRYRMSTRMDGKGEVLRRSGHPIRRKISPGGGSFRSGSRRADVGPTDEVSAEVLCLVKESSAGSARW